MEAVIKLVDLKQNLPINESVFNGLRQAIIQGIIPAGDRINEKEYAERLNISRTPIREALRRLEKEQLVEKIPGYGTVVKKITVGDAIEIFKIRKVLEVLATTNAMHIMSEEDYAELRELLERTDEANNNDDVKLVTELFGEFNAMIYRFSKMPRLAHIVTALSEYLKRFRDISLRGKARRDKAISEHWMIYEGMRDRDEERITLIITKHLDYSKDNIIMEMVEGEARDGR
ncbi:GntR family transcriptional regulator [Jeotgalibaca sp. A122]|uniref:GntR family transcriptional regulator n=1 Tax=Jeotgalibaca sp. A122 TaxID=3457322 RepID=UPI003FD6440B